MLWSGLLIRAALSLALLWSIAMSGGEARAQGVEDGCPALIVLVFGEQASQACRVAWCESRWQADAISPTQDYGLFQINRPSHGEWASLDPEINVAYAYRLSRGGYDWSHWSCRP